MKSYLFVCLVFHSLLSFGQDIISSKIRNELEKATFDIPTLEKKVELSINGAPLNEVLRGIGNTNQLNLTTDNNLTESVVMNFSDVKIKELFYYLCQQYDLDLKINGSIIHFSRRLPDILPVQVKQIIASYDASNDKVSFDLQNDSLYKAFRKIADVSGKNLLFTQDIENKLINGYIQNMPFDGAIEKLALLNQLNYSKTKDNYYLFETIINQNQTDGYQSSSIGISSRFSYKIVSEKKRRLNVEANNIPISEILNTLSDEFNLNAFFFAPIQGSAKISVRNISFDHLLQKIFENTDYTFSQSEGIYFFGQKKQPALISYELIPLKHRSIEKLKSIIPQEISKELEIIEDIELNSFIVSGSGGDVFRLKKFLTKIDQSVPVILIEIMILEVSKNFQLETGIDAGVGENAREAARINGTDQGTLFPNYDYTFGSSTINRIITGNTFSSLNLGKVTADFFLRLKFEETNGNVRILSTPNIATINGRKATLEIGQKTYYRVQERQTVGTQNPIINTITNFEPIEAKLIVEIQPVLAQDNQITMNIKVEQSRFGVLDVEGITPPDQNFRTFNSILRVGNKDLVILGGLEDNQKTETGSGVPFLSRIPILKWFFSSKTKNKSKSKLSIFIKPTIIN